MPRAWTKSEARCKHVDIRKRLGTRGFQHVSDAHEFRVCMYPGRVKDDQDMDRTLVCSNVNQLKGMGVWNGVVRRALWMEIIAHDVGGTRPAKLNLTSFVVFLYTI